MKFIIMVVALFATAAANKTLYMEKYLPSFLATRGQSHRDTARSTAAAHENSVETKWMPQPLDHFDKHNTRKWLMRYMVNEEHFRDGGPMFILLGAEHGILHEAIQTGILVDLAKEHKGILFHTEHRYYGESNPTRDLSIGNLKYLHSKQALADLAVFIRTQRAFDSRLANSKVIIAGGSYAGSLVVWFSKLYPELVNGGWASSAPLLAQVDFKEYNEISGRAFRDLGSQQCYNRIQNGIAKLENMFENNGWAEAKAMLLLCDYFDHTNHLDMWSLFYMVVDSFTKDVLYQTGEDIPNFCSYIMSFEDDLTAVIAIFLVSNFFGQECVDVTYGSGLTMAMDLTFGPRNPRPWFYQLCNEFGWFQTTSSRRQPFGTKAPATLPLAMCNHVFGPKYSQEGIHELVAETNKFFGGFNPSVKNVYMTHGALDPWSHLGHNKIQGASVIPGASHCSDFASISIYDSPEMRASKQRLVHLVQNWLA